MGPSQGLKHIKIFKTVKNTLFESKLLQLKYTKMFLKTNKQTNKI